MIAPHREEVRDLNHRARVLLDAAGMLGPARLRVAGREFAEGDRIMATGRNLYDLDIVNGDLGTITRLHPTGEVTFTLDRTRQARTMPADLVAEGLLDHAYARTNHKAQGATVDRAFILGDDGDLDHQAGYAALSRGRIENRLYVLTPDTPHRTVDAVDVTDHVTTELSRDRSHQLASEHHGRDGGGDEALPGAVPTLPARQDPPPIEPPDLGIDLR